MPRNVTLGQLDQARALVAAAQASQATYNRWNMENPRFNNYYHRQSGGKWSPKRRENDLSPPKFSDEVIEAIRLIGDIDAEDMLKNGTFPNYENDDRFNTHNYSYTNYQSGAGAKEKRASGPWLGQIKHNGSIPFGGDASYQV